MRKQVCFEALNFHILLFLSVFLFIGLSSSYAQNSDEGRYIRGFVKDRIPAHRVFFPNSTDHKILPHPFDVRKYKLDLKPAEFTRWIDASVTIESISEQDGLDEIKLNFVGDFKIHEIKVNGKKVAWKHNGKVLKVDLGKKFNDGKSFKVVVKYSGRPQDNPNALSFGQFTYYLYGVNGFTFFQPFSARYFFPCFDEPSDKAEEGCEAIITVMNYITAVSNGVLVSSKTEGENKIFHYRHKYPIATYLICVVVGMYEEIHDEFGDVQIIHHVFPDLAAMAQYDFAIVPEMMNCYSKLFGEYPFDKYGMVLVSGYNVGCMEHQTMTTLEGGFGVTGDRSRALAYAHELAHHWWGNSVTIKDYKEIWLNEGFAIYCEALWNEHVGGLEAYNKRIDRLLYMYLKYDKKNFEEGIERQTIVRPDYDVEKMFYWLTTYYKAGLVLHMLRWEVGDKKFFKGMKEYYGRHAYSNVTTSDFIDAMEWASKRELDDFFHSWIYGTGHPEYEISSFYRKDSGRWKSVVTVRQVQDDPTLFSMTLPIDPDGDGPAAIERQYVIGKWCQFEIEVPGVSGTAQIDESKRLLMEVSRGDYAPPEIKKVRRGKLKRGETNNVVVAGKNFTPVSLVEFSRKGIEVESIEVDKKGKTIKLQLTVPDGIKAGPVDLTIINPDGDKVSKEDALQVL